MTTQSTDKFSGWVILVSCFTIMFFVQGGLQTFAVFLPAIMKDTGFNLGQVAMISTISTVAAFLANVSLGSLLKKMSAKWILFVGAMICASHFVVYSFATSLTLLYVGAFLGGISIGFGTVAPVSVIMTNWFIKKRATYMSIVIAGSMFGGAVLMPISGQLIYYLDWRVTYRLLSLVVAMVSILVILFILVDDPKKKNQKAYGADTDLNTNKNQNQIDAGGVTLSKARSTISFWLLLFGILLIGCSTNIENYLPAFWQSNNMSVKTSSSIMGLYALITGIATIILGRVSDKLGGKAYIAFTGIMFILGTGLIYFVGAGAGATYIVILAVIPFAIGAKKTSTLTPPLVVAESFGRKHYGAIIGYFAGMLQLGIAVSNPIIGSLHKSSGGFKLPFTVMGILSFIALILVISALFTAPYKKAPVLVKDEVMDNTVTQLKEQPDNA
jgi:MFS family permease